jgi:sugar phosphate permease
MCVPASRAALNAVPQAKHGRVSSLLSTCRLLGAAVGSGLAGAALSGGVTASHVRIAMLCGAGICVLLGLPASAALASGKQDASQLDFEGADRAAAEVSSAGLNRSRR